MFNPRLHQLLRLDGTGAARRRKLWSPGFYFFAPNSLDNRIELIVTAPLFDAYEAAALASRDAYADVVSILQQSLGPPPPRLASLFATAPREFWPQRLARTFGVIPPEGAHGGQLTEVFSADDLRASAHPEARTALAALGEIPWPEQTCRDRSAFLLAHIVTRMRRGANG